MADDKTKKQAAVTVVLDDDLLPRIEARTKELDLNRSQYFRRLLRQDLESAKPAAVAKEPEPVAA